MFDQVCYVGRSMAKHPFYSQSGKKKKIQNKAHTTGGLVQVFLVLQCHRP